MNILTTKFGFSLNLIRKLSEKKRLTVAMLCSIWTPRTLILQATIPLTDVRNLKHYTMNYRALKDIGFSAVG